jgi:hypothetical protein
MRKYIKLFQQKADNALEALTALRSKGARQGTHESDYDTSPFTQGDVEKLWILSTEFAIWQKAADILRRDMAK